MLYSFLALKKRKFEMKNTILFLSIFFVFTINIANASYYNNNTYQLNNQNSTIKQPDYYQDSYHKTRSIRPYIGIEFDSLKSNYSSKDGYFKNNDRLYFRDTTFGASGILGLRFYKHFGVEGFYKQTFSESKKNTANFDVPVDSYGHRTSDEEATQYVGGQKETEGTSLLSAYGIDFIGYLPLNQQLELLASVGIGQYDFEMRRKYSEHYTRLQGGYYYDNQYSSNKDFDSAGIRIGLGLQYTLEDLIAFRGMVHYVKLSDDDYVKDLMELSLGVYYLF